MLFDKKTMQGSRKTKNSSKGRSSEEGSEVQAGSDSERFQEGQEDSHGEEGSGLGQGEAGLEASADKEVEAVQSKGGSAGPDEDEDSSSREANGQQRATEAEAGGEAPALKGKEQGPDAKNVKPALPALSAKSKVGSMAGAKLGMAVLMAAEQTSKGGRQLVKLTKRMTRLNFKLEISNS